MTALQSSRSLTGLRLANALMIGGPLSKVMECIPDTIARRDSIRSLQAARLDAAVITQAQKATRALQVQSFCDGVNQISARLDSLEKRRARKLRQIAAQQEAAEQKQIADYLNTLPDPDNPLAPASFTTGDLCHYRQRIPGADEQGDLPAELQERRTSTGQSRRTSPDLRTRCPSQSTRRQYAQPVSW